MLRLVILMVALATASGCVGARPLQPTAHAVEVQTAAAPEGALTLERAWGLADRFHPELAALRQAIRSVNLRPGPEPIGVVARGLDGDARDLAVEGELLSLLGIGPRAAQRRLAFAQRLALQARLRVRQVALAAELAEAFARVQALDALEDPGGAFDLSAYEEAGLVPGGIRDAAASTLAEAQAERDLRATLRLEALRRIAERVGAAPLPLGSAPSFDIVPTNAWAASLQSEPDLATLVRVHPELHASLAEYRVADRALRAAVAAQLPGVILRLGGDLELDAPLQLLRIRLPLGAPAVARAAQAERLRAFEAFRSAAHRTRHAVAAARMDVRVREAELRGARAAVRAAASLREAALVRADTDSTAIAGAVLALTQEVQAARRLRMSALQHAEAELRAATSGGWPYLDELAPFMSCMGERR